MTTKNIYSRSNNACFGVCKMVFTRIVSMKKGYLIVFEHIVRSFEVYY